jgi:hypothetical protein
MRKTVSQLSAYCLVICTNGWNNLQNAELKKYLQALIISGDPSYIMKALQAIGIQGFSDLRNQEGICASYSTALQQVEHHCYRESVELLLRKYSQDKTTDLSRMLDDTNAEIVAYFVKMWREGYFDKIPVPCIYPIDGNLLGDASTTPGLQKQITDDNKLIGN